MGAADPEFGAEANHRFVREVRRARSANPARAIGRGSPPRTASGAPMVRAFPRRAYRRRMPVEAPFPAATRTQGGVVPARSARWQIGQAHLLGASFNVARLRPAA